MKGLILPFHSPRGLAPITAARPLEALPVLGRPVLAWQLSALSQAGVREVLVVLHHLPALAEAALAQAPADLRVHLALCAGIPTPAEILRTRRSFFDDAVLLLPSAVLPLGALPRSPGVSAILALPGDERAPWRLETGAQGRVLGLNEGPEGLPTDGIAYLPPEVLALLTAEPLTWLGWLQALVCRHEVFFRTDGPPVARLESPEGLLAAGRALLGDRLLIDPRARVHPEAKLTAPAWIGPGCEVAREAELGPGVLLEGPSRVARGARLRETLVLAGTRVGPASRWHQRVLWKHGSFNLPEGARFELSDDPEVLAPLGGDPWGDRLGQFVDSVLAGLGLFLLAPVMLLIALAIVVDDPGPVFYTQLRVGQDRQARRLGRLRGRVFELYKFRTMARDADHRLETLRSQNQYGAGAFFKLERDPRITRVGHWLRRTSLDELPQLLNVLRGDMRLVGNRPLPVYEAEALHEDWQRLRFAVPAGITGLWQISGRSELSERERMVLDATYAVSRTAWTDLGILLKTVPALWLRRGAR